jgi:hypothetical protein
VSSAKQIANRVAEDADQPFKPPLNQGFKDRADRRSRLQVKPGSNLVSCGVIAVIIHRPGGGDQKNLGPGREEITYFGMDDDPVRVADIEK